MTTFVYSRCRRLAQVFAQRSSRWLLGGAFVLSGCLDRPVEPADTKSSLTIFERLSQHTINRIDLLLAIDNSSSMADKQQILAQAVPNLIERLVNPPCLDSSGKPSALQPAGALEPCPEEGSEREFAPVLDIHIGMISSSLGGHGADSCPNETAQKCASGLTRSNNDRGHLLSRTDPCGDGGVDTYQNKGFLAWDPAQNQDPPGQADQNALVDHLRAMVVGVGQVGCGYESQLESWYRFLVDPEPYASLSVVNGSVVPEGIDEQLLTQRKDFLRPDSLVAVLMLSDENDCSIKEFGGYFAVGQLQNPNGTPFRMPAARAVCAANPNDPCCFSCAQDRGTCPDDPSCYDANGFIRTLSAEKDSSNLRCFDQKRRFGIDFLYPIERYSRALTELRVENRRGELVDNPLFSDLDPSDSRPLTRGPNMVFLAGLVGVPWQDLAADSTDLSKGYKPAATLGDIDPQTGYSVWDLILGNPQAGVAPRDPLMIESQQARSGVHPITGEALGGDCQNSPDSIHGCERPALTDDLQYACVFSLPEPVDCSAGTLLGCECKPGSVNSPLCAELPNKPGDYSLQVNAKAYPGTRELQVLQGIGDQAIVASVCAAELKDSSAPHYGYQPAVFALVDRLKERIRSQCLSRELPVDDTSKVPCTVIESKRVDPADIDACNACNAPGRSPIVENKAQLVDMALKDPACANGGCNCFCEVAQLEGSAREACQNDVSNSPIDPQSGQPASGFCYIDATAVPSIGNSAMVSGCASTEQRMIRFVGGSAERESSTMFIRCAFERDNN